MPIFHTGDKVKFGSSASQKGEYMDTLTRDTVIDGVKHEASAAHPKALVRKSSGGATVVDPKNLTKI